ncbi:hypothetical protein J6590_060837 [Homalodisca vitripennis]|nr:hypothetical protein J6590_060837 [Homalodisca vitripennis]
MAPKNFPCGECGIGVKYAGIKCTGHCLLWYHAAYVSIPEGKLTKMTKSDENAPSPKKTSQIPELEEVKSNLQENEAQERHLETSLTLAAEAGNALLLENYQLKQDIQNKQSLNFFLKANLASMEANLEDLLANEEKYINEIEALQVKLQDTLLQLEKSKLQQVELQNISEEHDQTQNHLISQLKHSMDIFTTILTTPLLLEVTLRKRQEEMEHTMRELADKLKNNPNPEQHKIKMVPCPTIDRGSLPLDNWIDWGIRKTPTEKLSTTTLTEEPSHPALTEESSHPTTSQAIGLTGGISQTPTEKLIETPPEETSPVTSSYLKVKRCPPVKSKKLGEN